MEPEGSSAHSQAPAICPYPEPAQSSPEYTLLSKNFNIYNKVITSVVTEVSESSMMQAATGAVTEGKEEDGSHTLLVLMAAGKRGHCSLNIRYLL